MRKSLALFALLVTAYAGNALAVGQARITGKVIDAATKQGIADVKITVTATEAKTFKEEYKAKPDGSYAVAILDGTIRYKFVYSAPGYAPYEEVLKLKIGEPNFKDVVLSKGVAVSGGGTPIPAAAVDPAVLAFNDGAALANDGKDAEALAKFTEAVTAKPDLVAGWGAIARVQLRLKAYPKAIEAATKVTELDPDDTAIYSVLFEAYTASGDKAKAAEAKKKMPASAPVLFNDAARAINAGNDAEAEKLLLQAISVDETFSAAVYELGMVYVRSGKNAEAKQYLEKYLAIDPNGRDAATAKEMLKYVK